MARDADAAKAPASPPIQTSSPHWTRPNRDCVAPMARQMAQSAARRSREVNKPAIANINERLLILMDIESLMSSSDMGLINDLTDH